MLVERPSMRRERERERERVDLLGLLRLGFIPHSFFADCGLAGAGPLARGNVFVWEGP